MAEYGGKVTDLMRFTAKRALPNAIGSRVKYVVRFATPEFTALSPMTQLPDSAYLVIDYIPNKWLMEKNSMKFYLNSFRNQAVYQEECVVNIGLWLAEVIRPHWLRIGGYWYPHGSVPIDVFWQTGEPPKSVWIPEPGGAPARQSKMEQTELLAEMAVSGFC